MATRLGRVETIDDPTPSASALTFAEVKRLRPLTAGYRWWETLPSALWGAGCTGGLVFAIGLVLLAVVSLVADVRPYVIYLQVVAVVGGLCVVPLYFRGELSSAAHVREQAQLAKQDIANGMAHYLNLNVKRVVEIEEYEDEGAGFFLELTDGRVLCLISQDLYEYASDVELEDDEDDRRGEFPRTRIRYRYAPHSGKCLDIAGIGEPLRPFGKVKTTARFFKKDKETGRRTYTCPEDGMVYAGPLEATLAGFKYKLKPL